MQDPRDFQDLKIVTELPKDRLLCTSLLFVEGLGCRYVTTIWDRNLHSYVFESRALIQKQAVLDHFEAEAKGGLYNG